MLCTVINDWRDELISGTDLRATGLEKRRAGSTYTHHQFACKRSLLAKADMCVLYTQSLRPSPLTKLGRYSYSKAISYQTWQVLQGHRDARSADLEARVVD